MLFRNEKRDPRETPPQAGGLRVPLLPLRDIIVFPHMVVPLFVGRQKSIRALEEAMNKQKFILLAAQKDAKTNDPAEDDIYRVGTLGTVVQLLRLPDGTVKVLVEGKKRARVMRYLSNAEYFLVEAEALEEVCNKSTEVEALIRSVNATFETYVKLDKKDEFKNEIQELEEKIKQKKMSAEAREKAEKELKKLKMMSPMSAEATVVRNYIDWLISLPWHEYTEDKLDIKEAEKVLEDDHFGLEKVKQRILEYLAVQSLVGHTKGPILCLVGPPGVGKTSLGKSIARATGRKFVRVSLGGVRDEAEIRGHRRTYIGALPGKVIQCMKRAGSGNPVFLLDEVDKMSTDFPAAALRAITRHYTKEAGVRNLEREIASVCRKVAVEVVKNDRNARIRVSAKSLNAYLGPPRYRYGKAEVEHKIGVATGLAWTDLGGELLATEVQVMPGKGKLLITGRLGEVMQESAQAAMSYVRSRAEELGLERDFYQKIDIHLHIPEGAIPKDGPSAGITMATTLVSALTKIPVRHDTAMTGEITLRGRVLPIGGLKEKILAAHRGGIKRILVPLENEKDLQEVPATILRALQIEPVENMDDVP